MFIMFKTIILVSAIVLANSDLSSSSGFGYYWREYTGTIPVDAVIAGKGRNGQNIYIGQAYVQNEGLIVVEIKPGDRSVDAPIKGVKTVNRYIKILCGPPQNFTWVNANSWSLHLALLHNRAVIGGHEGGGQLNIGRIHYEGGTKIGKIIAFNIGKAYFYYVGKWYREYEAYTYQVLCIRK